MISRKRFVVVAPVVVVIMLLTTAAGANPRRFLTTAQCTTEAGSKVTLEARTIALPEGEYNALNEALRVCKDKGTQCQAENKSLRKSPDSSFTGWLLSGAAVGLGILIGRYAL